MEQDMVPEGLFGLLKYPLSYFLAYFTRPINKYGDSADSYEYVPWVILWTQ